MAEKKLITPPPVPPGRLPSFRAARDLTLGGLPGMKGTLGGDAKSRKTYAPNLNVQRNKPKEESLVKNSLQQRHNKQSGSHGGRKRGRGRGANNLVQASGGVFSEGSAVLERRRFDSSQDGSKKGSNYLPIPKLNLKHDRKIDKELEELKLQELLRDDFLEDPALEPDASFKPLQLPFHVVETTAKKESNVKKEEIKAEVPNVNHVEEDQVIGGVKIKQEPVDMVDGGITNMFSDVKVKQEKLEVEPLVEEDHYECDKNERTVAEFFNTSKLRYFFLQLPDCMPGLKPEVESGPARPSTSKNSTPSTSTSESSPEEAVPKNCTLNTLSEGYIGKIQLMKSGKARIILNNTMLHVASSLQLGYREDLVSVHLDPATHTGDMINLGPVEARLLCSPHWESMIPSAPKP